MTQSNVIVITGGGGGIGLACARLLGKRGTLLISDINPERVKNAINQLRSEGFNVEPIISDISKENEIEALVKTTSSLGRFVGIVHTAGLSPRMAEWQRIFEVNLASTARLIDAFLPLAGPGTVAVCLASMAAYTHETTEQINSVLDQPLAPDFYKKMEEILADEVAKSGPAYSLSKLGVIRLCAKNAFKWGAKEARILSVSPGMIDTSMLQGDRAVPNQSEFIDSLLEMAIQRRLGRPEELAKVVAFLMSEDASYINGAELLVDGGVIAAVKSS